MTDSLERSLIQIIAGKWFWLNVLTFSVAIQVIPTQAQQPLPGVNCVLPVRVDNWANIQVLLNTFANCSELLGVVGGLILILHAAFRGKLEFVIPFFKQNLIRRNQVLVGFGLMVIALAIPSLVNWFCAPSNCL